MSSMILGVNKMQNNSHVQGKQIEALRNLPSLTAVNAGRNLAFIGPQGVGKTHLAMAYG